MTPAFDSPDSFEYRDTDGAPLHERDPEREDQAHALAQAALEHATAAGCNCQPLVEVVELELLGGDPSVRFETTMRHDPWCRLLRERAGDN